MAFLVGEFVRCWWLRWFWSLEYGLACVLERRQYPLVLMVEFLVQSDGPEASWVESDVFG